MSQTRNPAPLGKADTGFGVVCWGADNSEPNTARVAVQRLSRRYGLPVSTAAVVAFHAGLGPQEVRR